MINKYDTTNVNKMKQKEKKKENTNACPQLMFCRFKVTHGRCRAILRLKEIHNKVVKKYGHRDLLRELCVLVILFLPDGIYPL